MHFYIEQISLVKISSLQQQTTADNSNVNPSTVKDNVTTNNGNHYHLFKV